MKNIRKILTLAWNEFVFGGHLLSLGASCIIYTMMMILGLKIKMPLLSIMYLMPQIIYTYDHFKGAKQDALTNPERVIYFTASKKKITALLFVYIVALAAFLLYLNNWQIFLAVAFITVSGLLYTDFLKGFSRRIIGFKNIFVAFVWAATPTILILLYYHLLFSFSLLLLCVFVFMRLVMNTIFFDIKDMATDNNNSIKTSPMALGKNSTIYLLHFISIISIVPIIVGVWLNILPYFSLMLLVFYFYSFYYLEKARAKKANIHFLSYVLADGEYILWPMIIFLVKFL